MITEHLYSINGVRRFPIWDVSLQVKKKNPSKTSDKPPLLVTFDPILKLLNPQHEALHGSTMRWTLNKTPQSRRKTLCTHKQHFHQIESASTRATLKCQSLRSWDTHRQWDSYLSVPILLRADLLIALWKPAWDISPGCYLATGGKKDTGLEERLLEGQNQRSLLHEWSRTEHCPATHMNSNLYLRLRSWKFNDIAFICGQNMSESVLSRASSSVLRADATRVMLNTMENYRRVKTASLDRR